MSLPLRQTKAVAFGLLLVVLVVVGCGKEPVPLDTTPTTSGRKIECLALTAKWCGVCKRVPPLFKQLREVFPSDTFREVDVDVEPRLAMEYDARTIPTFVFLSDGKLIRRVAGLGPLPEMIALVREVKAER